MENFLSIVDEQAWYANALCIGVLVVVKIWSHTKLSWAITGAFFLFVALTNAGLIAIVKGTSAPTASSLFGLVVLGSLGARFVGEWLTHGAKGPAGAD